MTTPWAQSQPVPGVASPAIRPLSVILTAAGQIVIAGDVMLCGFNARETTNTASAVVQVFNGNTTASQLVSEQELAPGQSEYQTMPGEGIWCDTGLFVNLVAGSAQVVCWVRDI
jgi:hypothetical protein